MHRITSLDLAMVKVARELDRERAETLLRKATEYARTATAERASRDVVQNLSGGALTGGYVEKEIYARTGYALPTKVTARYVEHEGKFVDRRAESLIFEDRGRSLITKSNDREVISHMLAVAVAKNWSALTLTGCEEFRRQAWIAAALAGVKTRGFSPSATDRAKLEAARQDMRISAGQRINALPLSAHGAAHRAGATVEALGSAASRVPMERVGLRSRGAGEAEERAGAASTRMDADRQTASCPATRRDDHSDSAEEMRRGGVSNWNQSGSSVFGPSGGSDARGRYVSASWEAARTLIQPQRPSDEPSWREMAKGVEVER